jgi:hypothetical protein
MVSGFGSIIILGLHWASDSVGSREVAMVASTALRLSMIIRT